MHVLSYYGARRSGLKTKLSKKQDFAALLMWLPIGACLGAIAWAIHVAIDGTFLVYPFAVIFFITMFFSALAFRSIVRRSFYSTSLKKLKFFGFPSDDQKIYQDLYIEFLQLNISIAKTKNRIRAREMLQSFNKHEVESEAEKLSSYLIDAICSNMKTHGTSSEETIRYFLDPVGGARTVESLSSWGASDPFIQDETAWKAYGKISSIKINEPGGLVSKFITPGISWSRAAKLYSREVQSCPR